MSKLKIVGVVLAFIAVLVVCFVNFNNVSASVPVGGEYRATTTIGMGSLMNTIATGTGMTLGSVVVASSSATTFRVWDATSTTDIASTTVVLFKASVGENTYTFDSNLYRGLIVERASGFNGSYTITYR